MAIILTEGCILRIQGIYVINKLFLLYQEKIVGVVLIKGGLRGA